MIAHLQTVLPISSLRRAALVGAGALLALGLSACGVQGVAASDTVATATGAPAASAAATAETAASQEIAGAFVRFFDGNTPVDTRINLLQDGQQYAQILRAASRVPGAQATSAEVSGVRVNGTRATVTYSLRIGDRPVLQDQAGTAVLVDDQWKVGDQTLCQVLSAQGLPNAQCA